MELFETICMYFSLGLVLLLSLIGTCYIIYLVIRSFIANVKVFNYRASVYYQDKRNDVDKRSSERQIRYEKIRQKDFNIEDKKLAIKFAKLDKKVQKEEERLAQARKPRHKHKKPLMEDVKPIDEE